MRTLSLPLLETARRQEHEAPARPGQVVVHLALTRHPDYHQKGGAIVLVYNPPHYAR